MVSGSGACPPFARRVCPGMRHGENFQFYGYNAHHRNRRHEHRRSLRSARRRHLLSLCHLFQGRLRLPHFRRSRPLVGTPYGIYQGRAQLRIHRFLGARSRLSRREVYHALFRPPQGGRYAAHRRRRLRQAGGTLRRRDGRADVRLRLCGDRRACLAGRKGQLPLLFPRLFAVRRGRQAGKPYLRRPPGRFPHPHGGRAGAYLRPRLPVGDGDGGYPLERRSFHRQTGRDLLSHVFVGLFRFAHLFDGLRRFGASARPL